MAQFSLPQNSKIVVGDYYKDKTNSSKIRKVNIYRWDPSKNKNPRIKRNYKLESTNFY